MLAVCHVVVWQLLLLFVIKNCYQHEILYSTCWFYEMMKEIRLAMFLINANEERRNEQFTWCLFWIRMNILLVQQQLLIYNKSIRWCIYVYTDEITAMAGPSVGKHFSCCRHALSHDSLDLYLQQRRAAGTRKSKLRVTCLQNALNKKIILVWLHIIYYNDFYCVVYGFLFFLFIDKIDLYIAIKNNLSGKLQSIISFCIIAKHLIFLNTV